MCGIENPRILDPIDTHWCYKYASCAISNMTSVTIELPLYDLPFLYVSPPHFAWANLFKSFSHICDINEVEQFLSEKIYKTPIQGLKEFYNNNILTDSKKYSAEILKNQLLEML